MGKEGDTIWFVIYLVVGGYFINRAITYIVVPKIITEFDKWIFLLGGILIIIGGISHLRLGSHKRRESAYRERR
jgi:hypothetical protein